MRFSWGNILSEDCAPCKKNCNSATNIASSREQNMTTIIYLPINLLRVLLQTQRIAPKAHQLRHILFATIKPILNSLNTLLRDGARSQMIMHQNQKASTQQLICKETHVVRTKIEVQAYQSPSRVATKTM